MRQHKSESCVCGHSHEAHEHYRSGNDCASCPRGSCLRYRDTQSLGTRVSRLLRINFRDRVTRDEFQAAQPVQRTFRLHLVPAWEPC